MSSASEALARARTSQPANFRPDELQAELEEVEALYREGELSLAGRNLRVELMRFRLEHRDHAAWVAAGAPSIRSDAEHREWFGIAYDKPVGKRGRIVASNAGGK